MYVVELTYIKPLEEIDVQLEAHRAYLARHYASETFLASGPKNPRDGGVILVSGKISRQSLEAILEEDPFKSYQLAKYDITEFNPVKFNPALEGII